MSGLRFISRTGAMNEMDKIVGRFVKSEFGKRKSVGGHD